MNGFFSFFLSKIRHYCDNALSIIMAFPSENPVLASNLQFVLSRTRGSDSAVESLRMALLGTAAIHQSFLLSRSGVCHGQGGADEVMQLANTFRAKSKQLLVTTCSTSEGARSDAALGAAVAIVLIDVSALASEVSTCKTQETPRYSLVGRTGLRS